MLILFGTGTLSDYTPAVPEPFDKNSGYCYPIIVVRPTDGAITEEGQIYDYRLTVVKKYQFIIWYWLCEVEVRNIVTGKKEQDIQVFTENQEEDFRAFMKIPSRFFLHHHIDVLTFGGKKMKHDTFLKHVNVWLKKK